MSLAADLVRDAGTLASEMLSQGLETRYKSSISDVVSAADHAGDGRVGRPACRRPHAPAGNSLELSELAAGVDKIAVYFVAQSDIIVIT